MPTPRKRLDDASKEARELAHKIAPLLKDLETKLLANGVSPEERTASYILLQAAAGFVVSEEGRRPVIDHLEALRDAAVDDFLEPQIF